MSCGVGRTQGSDLALLWLWRRPTNYSSDLMPSLGTSICCECSPKKTKHIYIYTHTHIYIHIYTYIYVYIYINECAVQQNTKQLDFAVKIITIILITTLFIMYILVCRNVGLGSENCSEK